jgi:glycerol-3-phosphate dehydrogenase
MVGRLERETFDVLVIGGGITGAGVALDAAVRGLRVALVERDDFASGTSSRSSKLVHGGLRYLQNGDIRLVYEALHERQRLLRNAPHLVRVLPFMIPVLTRDGVVSRKVAKALGSAMWMYDLTGGWRIGRRHRKLDADATFAHLPTMSRDRLAGGYLYYDASADDARLTLTVVRTAAAHGAAVANRCRVVRLTSTSDTTPPDAGHAPGDVNGAVIDTGNREITVHARVVVNATGVWADEIRSLEHAGAEPTIRPAKGVHVTVPWELVRNDIAVVIPVPKDRRSLFLVPADPRGDGTYRHTYVGTTDTDHTGSLDDPQCDADDLGYVLAALNHTIASNPGDSPVTVEHVSGVWAGLRPLVAAATSGRTADLSRNHQVSVSDRGVVSIAGGKLTTYRGMAEDTVDEVLRRLGRRPGRGLRRLVRQRTTRRLRLIGATSELGDVGTRMGHLRHRYGTEADAVLELIAQDPTLGDPLVPGQPHLRAEAVFAMRHEMATTLGDILVRRTRIHHYDREAAEAAGRSVAELMADELGWDTDEIDRQVAAHHELCERERQAARTARTGTAPSDPGAITT